MICGALGYLTPKIIDECSSGQPRGAGRAYTLNILGCILGPLFASYLLLPRLGLKGSIMAVTVLFLVDHGRGVLKGRGAATTGLLGCLVLCGAGFFSATYEEVYESEPGAVVLRDHMATVVSLGTGMGKMALVNGIGITHLTPVTEAMAHLPLAF